MARTAHPILTLLAVLSIFIHDGTALSRVTSALIKTGIKTGDVAVSRGNKLKQRIFGEDDETNCYEGIGCFSMDYPWSSILRPLPPPHSPEYIDVKLFCYTRRDPNERYTVVVWPDIDLDGCPIRPNRKLAIVTHGFLNNGNATWMKQLKDYYLRAEDATVCLVDWGKGAQRMNYLQAASNTRIVGAEIARFLHFAKDKFGVRPKDVHLIGHSLGAQISAYAAKRCPGVQRLTALDPAQPAFEGCDKEVHLHKDDALFVDVVHTNAAAFLPTLGFGMMEPVGDVDFYMNGGIKQPGCRRPDITKIKSLKDLLGLPVEVLSMWVACSHGRAFEYFTEVLNKNCTIWGRQASLTHRKFMAGSTLGLAEPMVTPISDTCDEYTCIPLNLETPKYKGRGVFVATTSGIAPFCTPPTENEKIMREMFDSTHLSLSMQGVVNTASKFAIPEVEYSYAYAK